jgi:hypothetical protein
VSDLVEFLRARLDEDEAVARAAIQGPWCLGSEGAKRPPEDILFGRSPLRADARVQVADLSAAWEKHANGAHIARWDPARVLAEVAAKRRVPELYEELWDPSLYVVMQHLAQAYADHADYDPKWSPS